MWRFLKSMQNYIILQDTKKYNIVMDSLPGLVHSWISTNSDSIEWHGWREKL